MGFRSFYSYGDSITVYTDERTRAVARRECVFNDASWRVRYGLLGASGDGYDVKDLWFSQR